MALKLLLFISGLSIVQISCQGERLSTLEVKILATYYYSLFLPASPQVEITIPSNTVKDGIAVTLGCSVTDVPNNSTYFVELLGPMKEALANSNNFNLTYTLDPVRAVHAGRYTCRADIEGMDMALESTGDLNVEGNDNIISLKY